MTTSSATSSVTSGDTTAHQSARTISGSRDGVIHQISVSNGGVPKQALAYATITTNGVSGDRQHDTRNHGGPERAVCLFSLEVIEQLRSEGHAIQPGSAGENLTISGLDWALVGPDARLRIGETVVLQLTRYTVPCSKIAASFQDGDFQRILYTRAPGESRIYARVLTPGEVRVSDAVVLLDATA